MARTIEFGNWRVSQFFLVFPKLEESSFYSSTCLSITLWQSVGALEMFFFLQPFCGRNSLYPPWGFENLDPRKNLHKPLSNPPKKKMISLPFLGGRNSPRWRGVWFGFGGSLLKTNEAPHPSGTVKLELALFAWPTSERPARTGHFDGWLPETLGFTMNKYMWFWPGGGAAPKFKTYGGAKKSSQTWQCMRCQHDLLQTPLSWMTSSVDWE